MPVSVKNLGVVALIVLPLIAMAVVKLAPRFSTRSRISSVTFMPTRFAGPQESAHLAEDVRKKLEESIMGIEGVRITNQAEADALISTSVTVDGALIQVGLRVMDARTEQVLFATPYQSTVDRYPEMIRVASAALRRALE